MRRLVPATILLLSVLAPLAACGTGADPSASPTPPGPAASPTPSDSVPPEADPPGGTGVIAVGLAPVQGVFIEGFEIGLRFEDAAGATIDKLLWTDFVTAQEGPAKGDYYGSVLDQTVPAGMVTVRATVNVGIGPPPERPDLDGPLACSLEVDVAAGARVEVEVGFDGTSDCLRLR